ncbi:SDR family NAD(P)-dependent oxidoreductase [Bacillus glycinifermentans]|uniref:Oxidoreductase n=1 Tax=Bacillus glycinifermentans TaxID=1664069 RepID=A0A0T6BTQ8_9BACI|nr:SDR family oxidoreductase [Bacillus glycinifermentans]ATH92290.1 NAD(P)-dependent oxidoreductase [Bacillus glycinifermentans]KRT95037.1 oxidoreductase [Bacillus glycinifermentans]MEC0484810.1 SDR family oxidoreductase [Bacillus glycinifermentans]MEC0494529.1 SDR family oxidoreductase [Bacillus glycinifermentans]MEC0541327.1 SDR family oxidoreductase [Bacillus glycinifermentans]
MADRLKGKNILITGASGGLGERIAYYSAAEGAEVILTARSEARLQTVREKIISDLGAACRTFVLDVSRTEEIESVFKAAGPIDILVNNAGFGIFEPALEASLEDMKSMFEVNVFGLIACTKMALPHMTAQNSGHIINIASQAGKISTPKSSLYAATKHAVLGFSNSLRMELAETGVNVTTVNPGPIRTDFFNAADKTGDYVKSIGKWMLDPDQVAQKIVSIMLTNKREINLPVWMSGVSKLYQLCPAVVEKIGRGAFYKK